MTLHSRLLFIFLIISFSLFSQNVSLERVEPPHWWAGMKHSSLQLLVHGENISQTIPQLEYEGVTMMRDSTLDSPNYIFIDLEIADHTPPGQFTIEFLKDGKSVVSYEYRLKKRDEGSVSREGFNRSDIIYLLMPDRFANADPSNDTQPGMREASDRSIPDSRHGGDIQGIINHLDYISDLGATSIWINPLLENDMPAYSYHGYAITDFYGIDARYGTIEDYKRLIDMMHDKDMKIIMDMVFNHCGLYHWWMDDLPSKDWIHQWPEFTRSNFRASTVFDPYVSEYDKKQFYQGWFDTNMPDLNQKNPFLMTYLIQNSIWWIEEAGLNGIRMDTYPYPYKEGMAEWAKRVMTEYPDFSIVAESWLGNPSQVAVWEGDPAVDVDYDSHVPYVFDFPLYDAFGQAFTENPGWASGVMRLYEVLSRDFLYGDEVNVVTFADNHDGNRLFSKLNERPELQNMAMTFLTTTRGIPQVYYGTEILMSGTDAKGHGRMRKDFPGGWLTDTVNKFTEQGRTEVENEAFNHLKTLLHYRKNNEVMQTGKLRHFIPEDRVYVYFRYDRDNLVMVILNNAEEERTLNTQRYNEMTNGVESGKNILDGKTYTLEGMKLPAKSSFVMELK
ncbi:MAG: glycoside hydrolase family 13 protein [Bacteroidales bacterium]